MAGASGRLVFAIDASKTYLAGKSAVELAAHACVGFYTEQAALTRRFGAFLPSAEPLLRTNSIAAAIAATKAGIGLAPLPCGLTDLEADFVRVAALPGDFTLDLWLLTHEDLRQTARIRAFLDFLAVELAREAPLLKGNGRAGPASSMQNHPMNAEARASATRR